MKIAVMGAGALGCYFGGRILQAGGDVSFIARGAHLEALRADGLRIESPLGDARIAPVTASDDAADIGEVDLVLFLVKLYDTEKAARAMAPLLGPQTAVLSFQNGVDAWQRIGAIVAPERVIGGTAYIPADIRAPGIVRHSGAFARLTFGEFGGPVSERCSAFQTLLEKAGVEAQCVENIDVRIWEKFIILSALSAITTLTRLPIGPIMADEQGAGLFEAALRETHAVGTAHCPSLPGDAADRQMAVARGFPPAMRASMLDDLERGKRLELRDLSGAVVRLGKEAGIATPIHETVLAALHPYADGPPHQH